MKAARKLHKVFKTLRTIQWLKECQILGKRWWETLESAELKWNSILFFDHKGNETARRRWKRAKKRAAKLGKGSSKSDKAQLLALPKHWLEAIDPGHRYGHNLQFYFDEWVKSPSAEPFFYWLDIGEGKKVDLSEKCSRKELQLQCVKYLSPMERKTHEVIVEGGKLLHKQNRRPLDTGGEEWIFVLSTSKVLYANKKERGTFHHSSFLAGAATTAAGKLVVTNGTLKKIMPHSGHYRPTEENYKNFVSFLEENAVTLRDVMAGATVGEECLVQNLKCCNSPSRKSLDRDLRCQAS